MDVYTAGLINSELRQRLLSRETAITTIARLKEVVATILTHMSKIVNQTPKEDLRFDPKGLGLTVTKTPSATNLMALETLKGANSLNDIEPDPASKNDESEGQLFFMDKERR